MQLSKLKLPSNLWSVAGLLVCSLVGLSHAHAQSGRWQQAANYQMEIDFDVKDHTFDGQQQLTLTNNSPDTLFRVFYHLYFNAFQPGSVMDVRSTTIADADPRVGNRISSLKPNEIGFLRVMKLSHDGQAVDFVEEGTILEVNLNKPILPGAKATFAMEFKGQVPLQIRRSGRDNSEGIAYSMAQWYPKMCQYDEQGWHANPYVGREFYGIWGDFDVKITIDKDYVLGGTGYLQNADEIGHGYTDKVVTPKGRKLTWHFKAPRVHDFMWAADPDYTHKTFKRADGMVMHFYYQPGDRTTDNWEALPRIMDRAFDFINRTYGQYPYQQYSFVQGGDGGMEYPMSTLITGERTLVSLVGVSVHELMHSWFQMVLASNECLYAWMDEGFTSYASNEVMNYLRRERLIPGNAADNPHIGANQSHIAFTGSGGAEPLSVHADHFQTNSAYGVAAYVKGEVFLHQMQYIVGRQAFDRGMLRYFNDWKFRHPNPNDFVRVMEKESGLELDWYREYMVNTTHLADYAVEAIQEGSRKNTAEVVLKRVGVMPMPIDVVINLTDGSSMYFSIPLDLMRGAKQVDGNTQWTTAPDWPWTNYTYNLSLPVEPSKIKSVEIDPSLRMADADRDNNRRMP